jgi:hypothetical protein
MPSDCLIANNLGLAYELDAYVFDICLSDNGVVAVVNFFIEIKNLECYYRILALCSARFEQSIYICFVHSDPVSFISIVVTPEIPPEHF